MNTAVVLQATIQIQIDESWQDSSPLSQIQNDAIRKAEAILNSINKEQRISITTPVISKVVLYSEVKS
jgi:hypothetical protein